MVDAFRRRSPLAHRGLPARAVLDAARRESAEIVLSERPHRCQVNLRGKATDPAFVARVASAIGLALPVTPNTTTGDGGITALWLGPDEWLVLGGCESNYPEVAATVDVSANRVCFELAGEDVEDVLAQGCSLDLHPALFSPGRCAQTVLAKAQVILHRTEPETFRIFVRPSFAPYLRSWLEDALTSPRSSLRRR